MLTELATLTYHICNILSSTPKVKGFLKVIQRDKKDKIEIIESGQVNLIVHRSSISWKNIYGFSILLDITFLLHQL